MIFRHATGDVRVMMLHTDPSFNREFKGESRAHVSRMQIVRDRLRLHAKQLPQILECLLEKGERFVILEIADMLTDESVMIFGQAKGIFEFGATRKNLLQWNAEVHRMRNVSA